MKKLITLLLLFNFTFMQVYAVEFDTSIDTEIRKNYNVQAQESVLPELPDTVPTAVSDYPAPAANPTGKTYTIKKGTKIPLVSKQVISDRMPRGSSVSFYCPNGFLTKEGAIIPAGTIFKGKITDSHPPQITGNGGLIELTIDEIYYNGVMSKINTKISLANSKKIFFSNIKGKRLYWKNFAKVTKPGRSFFGATQTAANAMSNIPIINLFSFVPLVGGAVFYTVNFTFAPVIAIFTKGGSIKLPAGSEFEIKVREESLIKG